MAPGSIMEGRHLLGWSRIRLAAMADVPYAAVERFENLKTSKKPRNDTAQLATKLRTVLEAQGVVFDGGHAASPSHGTAGGPAVRRS